MKYKHAFNGNCTQPLTNTSSAESFDSRLNRLPFYVYNLASSCKIVVGFTVLLTAILPGIATGQTLQFPYDGLADVKGVAFAINNGKGPAIQGQSFSDNGIIGKGANGVRGEGLGRNAIGVHGEVQGADGIGVQGVGNKGSIGVLGSATGKRAGVRGINSGTSEAQGNGVEGKGRIGVAGEGSYAGIYGKGDKLAAFFAGNTTVEGKLLVKEIDAEAIYGSKKLFKIDHPLEPATKYLSHATVESNEMTNLYSGNVVVGSDGAAWVELPSWFEALNSDFRYQLTCIGGFASVYIAQEIRNARFLIAGGTPGLKVSWQVTAVRHDAYAKAHPLHVEEEKAQEERGRYLNPVELGFAQSQGIDHSQTSQFTKAN